MNLWFGIHFLFAGLVLTSSALTDEECQPLKTPRSLANPSVLFGKKHFIAGYTDSDAFKNILNITDSAWFEISEVPGDPKTLDFFEINKLNGNCITSNMTLTINDNKVTASGEVIYCGICGFTFSSCLPSESTNITSEFHLLPGCDGCLVLIINTTVINLDRILKLMKIDTKLESNDITAQSFYLMANETSLPESDLENFKKQASCFGFTRDPDFQYDPKKAFCQQDEGFHVLL